MTCLRVDQTRITEMRILHGMPACLHPWWSLAHPLPHFRPLDEFQKGTSTSVMSSVNRLHSKGQDGPYCWDLKTAGWCLWQLTRRRGVVQDWHTVKTNLRHLLTTGLLRTASLFSEADTLGCNLITDVNETPREENPLIVLGDCGSRPVWKWGIAHLSAGRR